ncbi:hypothetical protein TURU_082468 [Turdus rufiventris]|nr:hypothetical protein TURU_082468 [Turdus rufiventris]
MSPQPEGLVASVLAASGLVARDPRFGQPCSTASATASLLASLKNPLGTPPCGVPDSPGEQPCPEDRPALSESRLRSLSRSALLAEVASAEMSLHAIYLHQLHQQQQQPQGPAGAPKHPFVTTGSAARASQLREMPLGGWAEEEEEEEEETMT